MKQEMTILLPGILFIIGILVCNTVLQHDVIGCAQQVEMLESQLAARMEQLQATVQSKTAVPTAQVYVSKHYKILSYSYTYTLTASTC